MSYDHPLGDVCSVPCRTCGAAVGSRCVSASNKPIVCPHSPRKADLRASVRDLEEDVAALDDRKRQVVRLAKGGLRMNGVWWGSDSGKRVRLSTTLVSELERWGALERVSGRELILSPYGERLLAELG